VMAGFQVLEVADDLHGWRSVTKVYARVTSPGIRRKAPPTRNKQRQLG